MSKLIPLFSFIALVGSSVSIQAADHLDAPLLRQPGQAQRDINDLYAFQSPVNPDNSVLILTVNPFAAASATFGTDVNYEFQIDNTGDAIADITYRATFGPSIGGNQSVNFGRVNGTGLASLGTTGADFSTAEGGRVLAGRFDDPFFFDLVGFQNGFQFTGEDAFAGADVSAIVFEVPSAAITAAGNTNIGVQAVTTVDGVQVDRIGRPAINTVLVPSDRQDEFNAASPDGDLLAFGDDVNAAILGLSNQENADALTSVLLPDLLTFDTSNPNGFLNGRQLADDVIDAELGLLSAGAVTTDLVPGNDNPFRSVFPFLAAANTNAIPEPATATLGLIISGIFAARRRRKPLR